MRSCVQWLRHLCAPPQGRGFFLGVAFLRGSRRAADWPQVALRSCQNPGEQLFFDASGRHLSEHRRCVRLWSCWRRPDVYTGPKRRSVCAAAKRSLALARAYHTPATFLLIYAGKKDGPPTATLLSSAPCSHLLLWRGRLCPDCLTRVSKTAEVAAGGEVARLHSVRRDWSPEDGRIGGRGEKSPGSIPCGVTGAPETIENDRRRAEVVRLYCIRSH